jgi:hypothetical protein
MQSVVHTRGTKKKLFCSWSCNRPNHVLYYFMWGYEMTFKKKSAATVKVSGFFTINLLTDSCRSRKLAVFVFHLV